MARALRSSVVGAAVDAYDRHVGRYGPELAGEMVRVSAIRPGQRALDVGCGTGALTMALAARLGGGSVAGIDPSERFVAACRKRVPGADVRVGTGEELPWEDDEFDVVLAQLVVDGMNDARHGAAEMLRVARPGGVLSACVWDFEEGMRLLRAVWDSALEVDVELARSFGADRRNPFSRPRELEELWGTTGLERIELGQLQAGADYADFATSGTRSHTASAAWAASTRRSRAGPRALQAGRGRQARIAVRPLPPDSHGLVCARHGPSGIATRPRAWAFQWAGLDSNQGPTDYESAALTN